MEAGPGVLADCTAADAGGRAGRVPRGGRRRGRPRHAAAERCAVRRCAAGV
jgi:hypothetical protein